MKPSKAALDFIVIGTQKGGTTALFEYMRDHPELELPSGKEAPFYSHDSLWEAGWTTYAARAFAFASPTRLWGTVTPHYMFGSLFEPADPLGLAQSHDTESIVPRRIREHSPDTRLIAVLRDPVERARSHHQMEVLRAGETRSFDQAVGELLEEGALERSRRVPSEKNSYVTRGEYARILAPYFELFGRDRVHICFQGDLEEEPAAVMAGIWEFLGVDETYVPPNLGARYRVSGDHRRVEWFDPARLQSVIARQRPLRAGWRALPLPVRRKIDSVFTEFSYRTDLRNRVSETSRAQIAGDVVRQLREHYADDTERLARMIGRRPSWA